MSKVRQAEAMLGRSKRLSYMKAPCRTLRGVNSLCGHELTIPLHGVTVRFWDWGSQTRERTPCHDTSAPTAELNRSRCPLRNGQAEQSANRRTHLGQSDVARQPRGHDVPRDQQERDEP